MEEAFLDLAVAFATAAFVKLLDIIDRKMTEREKTSKQHGKHAKRS